MANKKCTSIQKPGNKLETVAFKLETVKIKLNV